MWRLPSKTIAILGVCLSVAVVAVGGAAASSARHAASVQVCVLLPDTKSSVRWVQFDAPDFATALKKAGVTYSINNALNDPDEAEGTGSGVPGSRRQGCHRDRARQRLGRSDREAVHVRRRVRDRL